METLRVILFGPESSGKTTLSRKLSKYYKTTWVPEYMRDYLQHKHDSGKGVSTFNDVLPIAVHQMGLENKAARNASLILCDTDILEIAVYSDVYFQKVPDEFQQLLRQKRRCFYILCDIDTPWLQDDLRDKPDERKKMWQKFKDALDQNNAEYIMVKGNVKTRMDTSILAIDKKLNEIN